jgi:hypothetical protein
MAVESENQKKSDQYQKGNFPYEYQKVHALKVIKAMIKVNVLMDFRKEPMIFFRLDFTIPNDL